MEVIYRLGEASVSEVQRELPDPPAYSSVRTLLGVLETKKFLKHRKKGRAYVYLPVVSREKARHSALRNVVHNFFDGSVESVVATLMSSSEGRLTEDELDRLAKLIEEKRKEDSK